MYRIPSKIYYSLTQPERQQIKAMRTVKAIPTKRFQVLDLKNYTPDAKVIEIK